MMRRRYTKHERAFTIPELLVAFVVIGIIMSLASVEFYMVTHHFAKTSTELDSEREARTVMAEVSEQLRQASPNIAGGSTPQVSTLPVQSPVYPGPTVSPTPVSSVTFTMPTQSTEITSADPTTVQYDTVTIQQDTVVNPGHDYPDLLLIRIDPNNNRTTEHIGRDVASFSVTPTFSNMYDIDLTISPPRRADQASDTYQAYSLHSSIYVSYTATL